jgi:hypothetical protein
MTHRICLSIFVSLPPSSLKSEDETRISHLYIHKRKQMIPMEPRPRPGDNRLDPRRQWLDPDCCVPKGEIDLWSFPTKAKKRLDERMMNE